MAVVIDPTVQVSMIAAFASVIVALLGLLAEGMRRNHNALRAVKKDTRGTREQVENSHATNLRDDIDTLTGLVERVATTQQSVLENQREHGYELGHLRREQQQERVERLEADRRIEAKAAEVAAALKAREQQLDHNPGHNL